MYFVNDHHLHLLIAQERHENLRRIAGETRRRRNIQAHHRQRHR